MKRKSKSKSGETPKSPGSLIHLRPRRETFQVSQGRVVRVTGQAAQMADVPNVRQQGTGWGTG